MRDFKYLESFELEVVIMNYFLIVLVIVLSGGILGKETFILTEKKLVESLTKESPNLQQIFYNIYSAQVQSHKAQEEFQYRVQGSLDLGKKRDRTLSLFDNVVRGTQSHGVTLSKKTKYGVEFKGVFQGSKYNSTLGGVTSSSYLGAEVVVDLYKNFLGKLSRSRLGLAEQGQKQADLQKNISLKILHTNLRKIYWQYVVNNESLNVAKKLLKSAKSQVRLTIRKKKSGVAELGDVARFQSQVAERESEIISRKGAQKQLEFELRKMLPNLTLKKIKLGKYNLDKATQNYYECVDVIARAKTTPYHYSQYDELIEIQEKSYNIRRKITNAYDKINVNLVASAGSVGKDFRISDSRDDLINSGRGRYGVGIRVDIPLGRRLKKTKKAQELLDEASFLKSKLEIKVGMEALHSTIVESTKLLFDIIKTRQKNQKYLEKSLEDFRKKYSQARVSSQQLIQEEDAYLSNSLKLVDTQRQMIEFMLDYFAVFQEIPCHLNKELM